LISARSRASTKRTSRACANAGIVRHRGKIEAVINNAQRACELVQETGTLAAYFWSSSPLRMNSTRIAPCRSRGRPVTCPKDLKRRGWKFVGPTAMHALIQAMGLVNDLDDDARGVTLDRVFVAQQ
jgi:DNA-3-methyladenine glycosylase I